MRARWTKRPGGDEELRLHTTAGWLFMGWVQQARDGFIVFVYGGINGDYPENKTFETAKQARRALKAAAIVSVIGGYRGFA